MAGEGVQRRKKVRKRKGTRVRRHEVIMQEEVTKLSDNERQK